MWGFWFGFLLWSFLGFLCLRFYCLVVVFLMLGFICNLTLGISCVCVCVWVFVVGSDIFDFGCLEFFKSHLVGFNF